MPLHLLPLCSSQTNQHTKYKLCLFSWWAATFLMPTVPMWTLHSAHIGMQHGVVWGRKCHLFLFLKFLDATVTTINVELAIIILLFQDRTSPRTLLDLKIWRRSTGVGRKSFADNGNDRLACLCEELGRNVLLFAPTISLERWGQHSKHNILKWCQLL